MEVFEVRSRIQNPKSKIQNRKRAFVFVAALGVMAVGLLIAFAMGTSVQFTYYRTGASLDEVQERLMAQSAVDYTLHLLAQNPLAADGAPRPFAITQDHLRGRVLAGEVRASQLTAGHDLYKATVLAHRQGDVLLEVRSPDLAKGGRVLGRRLLLVNTAGARVRPIDVTQALRGAAASVRGADQKGTEVK